MPSAKDTEHYKLGRAHRIEGLKRYKFQDAYLQSLYDAGYDADPDGIYDFKVDVNRCRNCSRPVSRGQSYCDRC